MNNIQIIIEKYWDSPVMKMFLYLFFFSVYLLFFATRSFFGDDVWYNALQLSDVATRYTSWSSRTLIEVAVTVLTKTPFYIWAVLTALMMTLLSFILIRLFTNSSTKAVLLVMSLVCIYPINEMNSAGWIATTLNYLYPLAFGLIALGALIRNPKTIAGKVICSLSLIFACNQEQMAVVIFCFYAIELINDIKGKKKNGYYLLNLILSIVSLIYIFTCPGNKARYMAETVTWYPEYKSFGLLRKLYLGLVSTLSPSVLSPDILLLMLVIFSAIVIIGSESNSVVKWLASIPAVGLLLTSVFGYLYESASTTIYYARVLYSNHNSFNGHSNIIFISIFIVSVAFFLLVLYQIYIASKEDPVPVLVFIVGLFSRVVMGFSPTVYVSGMRTFIFYRFSIIIVILMLIEKNKDGINNKIILNILLILGTLLVFN